MWNMVKTIAVTYVTVWYNNILIWQAEQQLKQQQKMDNVLGAV